MQMLLKIRLSEKGAIREDNNKATIKNIIVNEFFPAPEQELSALPSS